MSSAPPAAFACVSAADAVALLRAEPDAIVFDVRDLASYRKAHVDGAAHLSEDRLLVWTRRLAKEAPVVIYCYHGNASKTYAHRVFRHRPVAGVQLPEAQAAGRRGLRLGVALNATVSRKKCPKSKFRRFPGKALWKPDTADCLVSGQGG
jgi:thiosulfate sulfurtransferase